MDPQQLAPLAPYFSSREFAILEAPLAVPFVADGSTVALLFIAQASRPLESGGLVEEAASRAASVILRSRAALRGEAPAPETGDLAARLAELMARADSGGQHLTFIELGFERIASGLAPIEPYRFRTDLARVLASMVQGSGEALTLGRRGVLLVLVSRRPHDERLIHHQIASALKGLLGKTPASEDLGLRLWSYPRDGLGAHELVAEINA